MLNNLLKKLENIALDPKASVRHYIKDKNMKAIGASFMFAPCELIDAAGMLPVGIWGAYNVKLDKSKEYFPAFCASIAFNVLELGIRGTYNDLSGIIIAGMSDTLICLGENWKSGVTNIPLINIVYPQNRKLDCGMKFLRSELLGVKKQLEEIKGSEISNEDITNSIEIYNKHRAAMRKFSKLASIHPNTINNKTRSFVFKSAHFMPKKEHLEIMESINNELSKLPEEIYEGKRIVVTGIIMDDQELLTYLEENKLRIVGDMLAHESMQYLTDSPNDTFDPIDRICGQWRDIEGFSVAFDPNRRRGIMLGELAKDRKADGVIYALTKFSDAEEYDMPICIKDVQNAGFQVLSFEYDQQDGASEQVKTRIQTFAEIL